MVIHITTDLEDVIQAQVAELEEMPPPDIPTQWLNGWIAALKWVLARSRDQEPVPLIPEDELTTPQFLMLMPGYRMTFGDLAIGDTFEWRDTREIQHGPPGPEPMTKVTATRYEWSKGYGTAEPHYPVRKTRKSAKR